MMSAALMWTVALLGSEFRETPIWFDNYKEALSEVQRTDKPLFIMLDSGSSSPWRDDAPFLSEQVETTLAADYIRLFVDIETSDGRELAVKFEAQETPRTVIIDRSGNWQVYRRSGQPIAGELELVLNQHRRAKLSSVAANVTVPTRTIPSTSTITAASCRT